MFHLYILYSPGIDGYYIGQTSDLIERMRMHAAGETQSTCTASDWLLVFKQPFLTRREAMNAERRLKKSKSRKTIERYIAHDLNRQKCPVPISDSAAW